MTTALAILILTFDIMISLRVVNVIPPAVVPAARAAAETDVERPAGTATTP
jgi:hypothetical protein